MNVCFSPNEFVPHILYILLFFATVLFTVIGQTIKFHSFRQLDKVVHSKTARIFQLFAHHSYMAFQSRYSSELRQLKGIVGIMHLLIIHDKKRKLFLLYFSCINTGCCGWTQANFVCSTNTYSCKLKTFFTFNFHSEKLQYLFSNFQCVRTFPYSDEIAPILSGIEEHPQEQNSKGHNSHCFSTIFKALTCVSHISLIQIVQSHKFMFARLRQI